jgi:hypothetical protein
VRFHFIGFTVRALASNRRISQGLTSEHRYVRKSVVPSIRRELGPLSVTRFAAGAEDVLEFMVRKVEASNPSIDATLLQDGPVHFGRRFCHRDTGWSGEIDNWVIQVTAELSSLEMFETSHLS